MTISTFDNLAIIEQNIRFSSLVKIRPTSGEPTLIIVFNFKSDFDNSGKRFATSGKNNSLIQFLSLCHFSNIANRDFENLGVSPLLLLPLQVVCNYEKMTNCYKNYLDDFFSTLLEYRHSTNRLNKVLKKDVEIYTKKGAIIHSSSALIVSDWSGPTDNGWELNFHTGIFKETTKDNYESEINKILSKEFCLMYSQSFEALETFLKNCLFNKQSKDEKLKDYIISLNNKENYRLSRESMPGGEKLFRVLKKAGGKTFKDFSKQNNKKIKFTELWTVLSETRNSITHSSSKIKKSKLNRSKHHLAIFEYLFDSSEIDDSYLLIELDYHKFDKLIKNISEFAFQILKTLSIEEKIEWNVY